MHSNKEDKRILDSYCFTPLPDADGIMYCTKYSIVGWIHQLNFYITIYCEGNKRKKPVEIFFYADNNSYNCYSIARFDINGPISEVMQKPNQIFGKIYAFLKALGIEADNYRKFFMNSETGMLQETLLIKNKEDNGRQ